jgi:hypothetical protein
VRWRRYDRILEPPRIGDWAVTHAAVPVIRNALDGSLELLFSPRDNEGRSHTGRADLQLADGEARIHLHEHPVLAPGALGAFDDSGAMGACHVHHAGREYLYYIGWNRGVTVPFTTFIGCAISDDGGRTFERVSRAPVLGRSDADPFLATSPWVMVDGDRWRMWYASGVGWTRTDAGPKHEYRIVYAESADGLDWRPTRHVCIDFASEEEYAIARPCIIRDSDRYRMWFSCRGPAYRIGYAESDDGMSWERDDERGGLRAEGDDWESRSVEYACVFDHGGKRWMLYNGNGYGETGVGLAVLEAS